GTKYNDINGDGIREVDGADGVPGTPDDEVGIANWTINLFDSGNNLVATTTTDSNGNYTFQFGGQNEPGAGTYHVREQLGAGWTHPSADPADFGVTAEDIAKGNTLFGGDFGNFRNVMLSGHKFEDHNGDDGTAGINGDDTPLVGWHIQVNGVDSAVT